MRAFVFFLASFLPATAIAAPTVYDCLVTKANKGPFAERMLIEFGEDGGAVRVDDALVRRFSGGPVQGSAGEMSDKKRVANWRVAIMNRSGQNTKMSYRAVVFSNGKLVLTAKPHGYTNNFTGRGRCRLTNDRIPAS